MLAGGLSICVLLILCFFSSSGRSDLIVQEFLILTIALNGTHFLASYRLLYSSRAFALSYPWAAIIVPSVLVLWGLAALLLCAYNPAWTQVGQALTVVAAFYLALHYTGQAWGMIASFSYLEGVRFLPGERRALRIFLRFLAAWQALWTLKLLWTVPPDYRPVVDGVSLVMNWLGLVSFVGGVFCIWRAGRRAQKGLSARIAVPYVALHVWYVVLYFYPKALFWIQLSHAVQYLPFPMRVELNRAEPSVEGRGQATVGVKFALTLLGLSGLMFGVLPNIATTMGPGAQSVWVIIAAIINIHHYFIDGCIWHISNPVVSKELFAHTQVTRTTS